MTPGDHVPTPPQVRIRPASRLAAVASLVLLLPALAVAQSQDRIPVAGQDLWLSGANVAWINFARDIGPGVTRLDLFEEMFRELRDHGGNSFRLWLHTNGSSTPQFSASGAAGVVVGPGAGAIDDLRAILDLAFEYDIALKLCLWSFDMLQMAQFGSDAERSRTLLTDPDRLQAYIDHALIPMVGALKGHPAILAWEIFNEPEGMSTQYGWTPLRVTMAEIQRFVNRTAGAIKRTDPAALVTNGSWSFRASSDVGSYFNYYRDDRLIAAGGDPDGTLDFYTVHYYEHFGEAQSPFHRHVSHWQLDKPVVIGEFFLYDTRDGNPDATFGVPWHALYETLYQRGYAGAMGWQWFDHWVNRQPEFHNWPRILENTQRMFDRYREHVKLLYPGIRATLTADRQHIEVGDPVTLSWWTRAADAVTLNGEPVEPEGSRTVQPVETTAFVLEATAVDQEPVVRHLTIHVVDPDQVNRALNRPAVASSEETCCGDVLAARYAVDGNLNTRWSSEWHADFADEDPNDEWIQIDLGAAFDISRVVLHWEVARARRYALQASFDGRAWSTFSEVTNGTGAVDQVVLETAVPARFVRMQGIERATQWGYSLWELEVYGLRSAQQPPAVAIVSPAEGGRVDAGSDLQIEVQVEHDRSIVRVDFYAGDELLGQSHVEPFRFTWLGVPLGVHTLTAVAFDEDRLAGLSDPVTIEAVRPVERVRYGNRLARISGNVFRENDPSAPSGTRLFMQGPPAAILWDSIEIANPGTYTVKFAYRLLDGTKYQFINVNGQRVADLLFDGPFQQWLTKELAVTFAAGINSLEIEHHWGWMFFDYIEVVGDGQTVSAEEDAAIGPVATLEANFPNPVRSSTTISFTLSIPGEVRLEVFDLTGRRVTTLVDAHQSAGEHAVLFDTAGLANGVYLYRLTTPDTVLTRRLVVLR